MSKYPVGCFGKLPMYGDFVKHNIAPADGDVLERWFNQALFAAQRFWGAGWETTFDFLPPTRFFINAPNHPRLLLGVMLAGCDRVGRRYPFAVVAGVPKPDVNVEMAVLPTAFEPFFQTAYSVMPSAWQSNSLRNFVGLIGGLICEANIGGASQRVAEFLDKQTALAFWGQIFGDPTDARKYVLADSLAEWTHLPTPRPALRFPKATHVGDAAFWLLALSLMSGHRELPAMTFWNYSLRESAPAVTVALSDTLAEDFLMLWSPVHSTPRLRLAAPASALDDLALRRARAKFGPTLDDPRLSLSALIACLRALR